MAASRSQSPSYATSLSGNIRDAVSLEAFSDGRGEVGFDGGKLLHIFFLDDCGNVVRQWRTENGGGDGINRGRTVLSSVIKRSLLEQI
jgi:hypothetical protein